MLGEIYNKSINLFPALGLKVLEKDVSEYIAIESMFDLLRAIRKTNPVQKNIEAIDDFILMLENYKSLNGNPEEIFNNIYSFLETEFKANNNPPKLDKKAIFKNEKRDAEFYQEVAPSNINYELIHLHRIYGEIYSAYSKHGSSSTQITPRSHLKTDEELSNALIKFVRIMDPTMLKDFMTADTYGLLISCRKQLQNDSPNKMPVFRRIAQIYCDTLNLHYSELKFAHNIKIDSTTSPTQWFDYKDNESAFSKLYNRYVRLANSLAPNTLYVNPKLSNQEICDSLIKFIQTLDLEPLQNEGVVVKQAIIISHDKESTQQAIYQDLEKLADDIEDILNNKPTERNANSNNNNNL
jgi:hypothetical protein